jgi:hypothetical protein
MESFWVKIFMDILNQEGAQEQAPGYVSPTKFCFM